MMRELHSISEWRRVYKSHANPKKTGFMPIGRPQIINKSETLTPLNSKGTEIKGAQKAESHLGLLSTTVSVGRNTSNLSIYVVWGSLANAKLQTLKCLQSIIENASPTDPRINNRPNVDQVFAFDRSVMAQKIVNKQCPESLWNKYAQRSELSRCNKRNNRNLDIPSFNLEG